jgi:uncharacterized protein YqeY
MGLKDQLLLDYKTAMKEHDITTKETVNLVRAAIKQHEVDSKTVIEDDAEILKIIKKQVKMRTDALEDFIKGGRDDLIEATNKEIEILKSYLPEELSFEEVKKTVIKLAEESGFEKDMKNMGALMKNAMAELQGKADGSVVSKAVKEFLSGE